MWGIKRAMHKYPTQLIGQLIWKTGCFTPGNKSSREGDRIPPAKVDA